MLWRKEDQSSIFSFWEPIKIVNLMFSGVPSEFTSFRVSLFWKKSMNPLFIFFYFLFLSRNPSYCFVRNSVWLGGLHFTRLMFCIIFFWGPLVIWIQGLWSEICDVDWVLLILVRILNPSFLFVSFIFCFGFWWLGFCVRIKFILICSEKMSPISVFRPIDCFFLH